MSSADTGMSLAGNGDSATEGLELELMKPCTDCLRAGDRRHTWKAGFEPVCASDVAALRADADENKDPPRSYSGRARRAYPGACKSAIISHVNHCNH